VVESVGNLAQALAGETQADVGDVLLTHSATERHFNAPFLAEIGLADRHFNIHARNGNLADNTAPVALSQAIEVRWSVAHVYKGLSRGSDWWSKDAGFFCYTRLEIWRQQTDRIQAPACEESMQCSSCMDIRCIYGRHNKMSMFTFVDL
jgi:hypothetical protein